MRSILIGTIFWIAVVATIILGSLTYTHKTLPSYVDDYFKFKERVGVYEPLEGIFPYERQISLSLIPYRERGFRRRLVVLDSNWGLYIEFEEIQQDIPIAEALNSIPISRRFVTDFASVPWYVQWLVPTYGRHAEAAIVHDWLYAAGPNVRDRKTADVLFYITMRNSGVGHIRSSIMYSAVRLFGGATFDSDKEWYSSFYSQYIQGFLPRVCVIDRPSKIWKDDDGGIFEKEDADYFFAEAWEKKLSDEACLEELLLATIDLKNIKRTESDQNATDFSTRVINVLTEDCTENSRSDEIPCIFKKNRALVTARLERAFRSTY